MNITLDKSNNIAELVLKIVGVVGVIVITGTIIHIDHKITTVTTPTSNLLTSLNNQSSNINILLGTLNKTAVNLEDVSKDLRLTVDNFNSAALDERFYFEKTLPGITKDITNILISTDDTIMHVKDLADKSTDTIDQANNTIQNINPILDNITDVSKSANNIINSPTIPNTLTNIQNIANQANIATTAIAKTATNVQVQENDLSKGWLYRAFRKVF